MLEILGGPPKTFGVASVFCRFQFNPRRLATLLRILCVCHALQIYSCHCEMHMEIQGQAIENEQQTPKVQHSLPEKWDLHWISSKRLLHLGSILLFILDVTCDKATWQNWGLWGSSIFKTDVKSPILLTRQCTVATALTLGVAKVLYISFWHPESMWCHWEGLCHPAGATVCLSATGRDQVCIRWWRGVGRVAGGHSGGFWGVRVGWGGSGSGPRGVEMVK